MTPMHGVTAPICLTLVLPRPQNRDTIRESYITRTIRALAPFCSSAPIAVFRSGFGQLRSGTVRYGHIFFYDTLTPASWESPLLIRKTNMNLPLPLSPRSLQPLPLCRPLQPSRPAARPRNSQLFPTFPNPSQLFPKFPTLYRVCTAKYRYFSLGTVTTCTSSHCRPCAPASTQPQPLSAALRLPDVGSPIPVSSIPASNFEFVSDFGLRISDFASCRPRRGNSNKKNASAPFVATAPLPQPCGRLVAL